MTAGRIWPAEAREFDDKKTGAHVRQLTSYRAHSHHLYFTNPGWYDDNRRLLFGGDRENRTHLFSIELASGEITQLTDLERGANFQGTTVNPARPEAYFWRGRELTAIDLETLERRETALPLSVTDFASDSAGQRIVCYNGRYGSHLGNGGRERNCTDCIILGLPGLDMKAAYHWPDGDGPMLRDWFGWGPAFVGNDRVVTYDYVNEVLLVWRIGPGPAEELPLPPRR